MSPSAPVPKSHQPRHLNGRVSRVVGPHRRRAEPEVPIQRGRHGRRVLRPRAPLRPIHVKQSTRWPVGPDVRLVDVADDAGPDVLAEPARLFGGLALVAHLRGHLRLVRRLRHAPRLPHRMRQRLLAIDMLAPLDGLHRSEGVVVVGRGDDHAVNVLHLVEHLPVVGELLCLGILLERVGGVALVHVAQRHDVLALHIGRGRARPGRRCRCRRG